MKECLHCGYKRQPKDEGIVPATECPKCGIIYNKATPPFNEEAHSDKQNTSSHTPIVKKQCLISENISASRPQYSLAITIAAAVAAIVIAAPFTAQFHSYLPMPNGWEIVRFGLLPLDLMTQLLRVLGGTFFGLFGGLFWSIAGAPLTEISILVGYLIYFCWKKSCAGVFVMLFCLGFSIINFAYYTADTKTHAITIIGGMSKCAGGAHGWDYMISAMGLANYSFGIGKFLFFAGCWLMSFALLAGLGSFVEFLLSAGFFDRQTNRKWTD
jgi:Zn ribbon nucleic-acid-binding protein